MVKCSHQSGPKKNSNVTKTSKLCLDDECFSELSVSVSVLQATGRTRPKMTPRQASENCIFEMFQMFSDYSYSRMVWLETRLETSDIYWILDKTSAP